MKIDRALFLFLTGAIAGAACSTNPAPPAQLPPTPSASAPPAALDASAPATPISPPPPVASQAPPSPTASALPPVASAAPTSSSPKEPPLPPVDSSTLKPLGPDRGCGKGKRTFDESKTNCDDMQGQYPDCGILQNGYASSEVCPGPVYVRRRCHLANSNFKPQVSQAVTACLGKTTGKYCNSCNIYQCGYNALMGACPDPTADSDCEKIARTCGGTDKARCRAYLSGMTQKGRDRMVQCLTTRCEKGFLSCMETLPETL